jgi:hypothetical protein
MRAASLRSDPATQEEHQVTHSRQGIAIALALLLATGAVVLLQVLQPDPPALRDVPRSLARADVPAPVRPSATPARAPVPA